MSHGKSSPQAKKYLSDNRILSELLSDNLSDIPDDILSDTESDSDRDSVTERKIVWLEKNYSDSETTSEESNSTSDAGGNHVGERRQNAKFTTFYWESRGETNSM
jgi:hypothetical protein